MDGPPAETTCRGCGQFDPAPIWIADHFGCKPIWALAYPAMQFTIFQNAGREGDVNAKTLGLVVFASAALSPLPALGRAQTMSTLMAVNMEVAENDLIGVRCQIKGSRRHYLCVIDSGATNTVISDQVIKPEGFRAYMDTTNGLVIVPIQEVSLIIADGPELKAQAFVPSKMPKGIQILIGQDVLRQFHSVVFDYKSRKIEFRR
jgi:hypothetical protein